MEKTYKFTTYEYSNNWVVALNKELRIIAGRFRGRKIVFDDQNTELRPTLDRVRETLFNWLSPYMVGAYCLDLFAGSGVFSCEAVSRGAEYVAAVENNHKTCQDILSNRNKFNIESKLFQIINQDVLYFLNQHWQSRKFDIIFLDPPYKSQDLLFISLKKLIDNNFLQSASKIYFEIDRNEQQVLADINLLGLSAKKFGTAGKVSFYLYEYI